MGEVYEALDRERNQRVALKTLRRLDAGLLYRLKTEFRSLQRMHHPNLISLGELIEAGGQWFFTMELIDGIDLVRWVRAPAESDRAQSQPTFADVPRARQDAAAAQTMEATVSSPALAALVSPQSRPADEPQPSGEFDEVRLRTALAGMVEGLSSLHRAGLIHRDVKPSNVMVTDEGRVVLLDFGLVQDTGSGLTEPDHHLLGTPAYMAPEQAISGGVSPASDWYSVGVTLYQALTGVLPFRGGALEMLHAKQNMVPAPPSSLVDEVPRDLDSLCMSLLAREPRERPSGEDLRKRLCGDSGQFSAVDASRTVFVGRGPELKELDAAYQRVRDGVPVALYVQGPSGVGKSALIEEFLSRLNRSDRNAVILTGRCYERESVPFKALDAVIDSLSRWLRRLPHTESLALLPEQMPALARIFPVLGEVEAVASSLASHSGKPAPQDLRGRAFAALKELFCRIADRGPLIVHIDDLQWGDADSAALISELLRPPRAPAMMLVGAFRSDETPGPVVDELTRRLAANPARSRLEVRELLVHPLSPEDARRLALALADDPDDSDVGARADAAVRESAGNPFFLGEMMRAVSDRGGVLDLDDVIRRRMRELPDDARALLEVIAVVGRPIQRGLALRAARLSFGGDSALSLLRAQNFVRTYGPGVRDLVEFFHDRIRETVVADIEPARLHEIHQRIAAVLESSDWISSEMLALAIEFAVGPDRQRAYDYAMDAANRAEAALAFARAAGFYELALELGPDSGDRELRRRRADVLALAGFAAEAAEEYSRAAAGAGEDEALELLRLSGDNLLRAGHIEAGLATLAEVSAQLGITLGRTRRRAIWSVVVKRARLATRGLRYTPRPESELPARELERLDALFGAATTLGMIDHLRGAAMQIEHLLRALRLGDERRVCRALETEAVFLVVQSGRAAGRADELSRDLVSQAERIGDPYLIGGAHLSRGIVGFFTSRYRLSHRSLREAERVFSEDVVGAWWERNTARYWLYMSQISMGDFTGVASTVERAIEEADQRNDFYCRSLFLAHPTAWYLLREDRPEDAERALEDALRGWPERPHYQAHYVVEITHAMLDSYCGRFDDAWTHLERAQRIARSLMLRRMPYVMGELHKMVGRVALARGDAGEARRRARALSKVNSPIGRGLTGLLAAPAAYLDGDDVAAERILSETVEHLDQCNAAHLAAAGRFRLGQLRGGSRGHELVQEATSWMRSQGVANIERMVGFLAPGFAPRS